MPDAYGWDRLNKYMNYTHWLLIVGALFITAGSYAYIRDTLKGKTKPNRVSWSMWALASLTGAGAALFAGADLWAVFRIFLAGFFPLLIFMASFVNPKSYWKLTVFDAMCGLCSFAAIFVWIGMDSPRTAILLAAMADIFASLPTFVKAWKFPETETKITYLLNLTGSILVIPSIALWNIENAAFPLYLLVCNFLLVFTLYRKQIILTLKKIFVTIKLS